MDFVKTRETTDGKLGCRENDFRPQLISKSNSLFPPPNFPSVAFRMRLERAHINNDGKVDIKDVSFVAARFKITPSHPLWDPVADLNGDNKIDIKDVSTVARHFGDHYP